MRLRPAAIAGALLLTSGLLAAGIPTNAVASAPRCTITGTQGNDRLIGTRGNDVICGLGGNDRIFAGPGQDVVRGGPGADRIYGGRGQDWLYGGVSPDHVDGGPGHDNVYGGAGADRLVGGTEPDLLAGDAGDDTCEFSRFDTRRSCVFDFKKPTVAWLRATPTSVDVSDSARKVTFRARLIDDTTVVWDWSPILGLFNSDGVYGPDGTFRRVKGTNQDGIWEATVTIPRGFPEAVLDASVQLRDAALRRTYVEYPAMLHVITEP